MKALKQEKADEVEKKETKARDIQEMKSKVIKNRAYRIMERHGLLINLYQHLI